jgi:hypothetical protein
MPGNGTVAEPGFVAQHRDDEDAAVAGRPLQLAVATRAQDVGLVHDAALAHRDRDEIAVPDRHGIDALHRGEGLRRKLILGDEVHALAVAAIDGAEHAVAETGRVRDDRLEHGLRVAGRSAHDAEHVGRGRLLLLQSLDLGLELGLRAVRHG